MSILGLDFGTKTGVAYGDAGAPAARVTLETWALPAGAGEAVGAFMGALRGHIADRLMRSGVSLVVFEAPYIAQHADARGRLIYSPNQIRRAFGAAAICEEICHSRGVACVEVVTSTLKKEFALHGRAQKADMIAAAKRRGFVPANDHEADAAACWLHGLLHTRPELASRYDPILSTGAHP